MALISKSDAFQQFLRAGRNSSHFVWFLADLQFFQCSNGWIFGFTTTKRATLFALEPLFPVDTPISAEEFRAAFAEVEAQVKPQISLFVSVYDSFQKVLQEAGFQTLQVGREPYVDLEHCVPTGKSGKSVRAARNQALRAGVKVEELAPPALKANPALMSEMKKILLTWKSRNLIDLGGFLNATDPFAEMEVRRYFLAYSPEGRLDAFLVATPIPGKNSFFLEDMVIRPGASRGAGELLTLEAMVALAEAKAEQASLGVVSMNAVDKGCGRGLSKASELLLVTIPKYLSKVYNADGLEMFRRRFKPSKWENVHLAMKNSPASGVGDTRAWLFALLAMGSAFRPRVNLSFDWFARTLLRPITKNPVSNTVALLFTLSYAIINKGGKLPEEVLDHWAFAGEAPLYLWPIRTFVSDFLFFDTFHFAVSFVTVVALLRWMEKVHKHSLVAILLVGTSFLDDLINQVVLIYPYKFFHPRVFQKLISIEDVGPSLWAAAFLGFMLCNVRRNREVIFTLMTLVTLLGFAFSASHLSHLILNLNHSLFLGFGFIAGKIRFEMERQASRQVARQKPPEGRTVLPQQPRTQKKTAEVGSGEKAA